MDGSRSPAPEGYEDVRRRLRERGYLEGRIERFLLQDLLTGRSGLFRLSRAALRAAVIGGPVLGALLAVAAALANRPLVGAADLLVLWVYFTPLSAAALFLLDLAVAGLLVALARRRGARSGDALRAALLAGLPTLLYVMLLWWKSRPAGGVTADALFLPVAVVATVLIAWLAGVVSLAGIVGRTGEVPDRRRRLWLMLALVLVPLVGAAIGLRGLSAEREAGSVPSAFEPRDSGRLLLLGVDGLDSLLVEAFEPRGALDSLMGLLDESAVYPRDARPVAAEPAEVWTTLMTGVPAREHGVTSAGARRLPGIAAPLSARSGPLPLKAALAFLLPARTVATTGAFRTVRTLWEIVALREPSLALGWWTSWPATRDPQALDGGYLVSDRVLPKLIAGASGDRDTLPPSLFDRLSRDFGADRRALREEFETIFRDPVSPEAERWLWESYLIDAYTWRVAGRLLDDGSLRTAFLYLPGLDILRHRLRNARPAGETSRLLETQAALEAYLRWIDSLLADVRGRTQGWQIVVVADPGRSADAGAEGFVAVRSPEAVPACVGPAIGELDLAPLVLALTGYPASREMPGDLPRGRCLEVATGSLRRIDSFGRRPSSADLGERSDFDPEMVERLKSLGYLN